MAHQDEIVVVHNYQIYIEYRQAEKQGHIDQKEETLTTIRNSWPSSSSPKGHDPDDAICAFKAASGSPRST